jgi:hypothetical protein
MGFYRANRMRVSIAGLRATLRNVCLLASQFNETWGWHEGVGAASSSTRPYFLGQGSQCFFLARVGGQLVTVAEHLVVFGNGGQLYLGHYVHDFIARPLELPEQFRKSFGRVVMGVMH